MPCLICELKKGINDEPINDHLVITIDKSNHTHVHGPFDNEIVIRSMLKSLIAEMEKKGIPMVSPILSATSKGDSQ